MFLRSNLRAAGLAWNDARYQGHYVLAWDGDVVTGVVAHAWNGMVMVQGGATVGALARAAVRHSGRTVTGFSGPLDQVVAARAALGLVNAPTRVDHDEVLLALALDDLVVPPALIEGRVQVRAASTDDRDPIVSWRVDYLIDLNGSSPGTATEVEAAGWFDDAVAASTLWVAVVDGVPVAISSFNARLPDCVQVGGVYTPPMLRCRGYARAVVAGSLLDARAAGADRAVLFTPRPDAVAAYRAIGFTAIGHYCIVVLA
jgi:uncharacterized protein